MDDMYTRNYGSMHDELVRMTEAEILLLFDFDVYTDIEIESMVETESNIVKEALDNLVSKGLICENNHYYNLPERVQDAVDCLKLRAIIHSKLLRDGIKGGRIE